MTDTKTAFGGYLLTKRLTRGGENLPQYMARYSISDVISESYYRDLEAGRKVIRIQSADELCSKLDLDRNAFYYFLLKDLLPSDVFHLLISNVAVDTFKSAADRAERLQGDNEELLKTVVSLVSDDITDLDDRTIDILKSDDALLGLLHFIYNRISCSFQEVDEVYAKCGGKSPISHRIDDFLSRDVISISSKNKTISRRSKIIKVPSNNTGRIFKDHFTINEVSRSLAKTRTPVLSNEDGTFQYNVIASLSEETVDRLVLEGCSKIISAVQSSDASLDGPDARPFFVSVIVSSRDEYNSSAGKRRKET